MSFIIPVYNEAENIKNFINALTVHAQELTDKLEIIIINDGSNDQSINIIKEEANIKPQLKLISFSRNFGKEKAITAGLEHCTGQIAIIIDADFQHPFTTLKDFLDEWANGYDMVYGLRDTRENETALKRFFSKTFYRLFRYLSRVDMPKNAGDFRLLDRKVINAINQCQEYNRFMRGLYSWVGFKSKAVYFEIQNRRAGKSKFSFANLYDHALTGIISFSDLPLRVWSIIGIIISSVSLIYALCIVIKTIIYGIDVPGYATIVVGIMFFGGIQLISVGILGEYIARIFSEVKQRPKYIIDELYGFESEE